MRHEDVVTRTKEGKEIKVINRVFVVHDNSISGPYRNDYTTALSKKERSKLKRRLKNGKSE